MSDNTSRRREKLTLHAYPDDLALGFSGKQWISHCERHDAKDNDPPFRDEQRAWYDALRDLVPSIEGLQPTVRLYARDMVWCSLDPDSNNDRQRFSAIIGHCMSGGKRVTTGQSMAKRHNSAVRKASVLRAALVFPQVDDRALFGIVPARGWSPKARYTYSRLLCRRKRGLRSFSGRLHSLVRRKTHQVSNGTRGEPGCAIACRRDRP